MTVLALLLCVTSGLDVRTFGAVGDGVHDDTAALQRAADALVAPATATRSANVIAATGKQFCDRPYPALYFPKGTYRVTGPVVFNDSAGLVGERGATVVNATKDQPTFYFRDALRVKAIGLVFEGGGEHLRQWTRNRDVASLTVSDCTFRDASDTAIVAVSYKWFKGQKPEKGHTAEENLTAERGTNGLYTLTSRGPVSDFTGYNNSTLIIVERCLFERNRTAFWGYSDGVTVRDCRFIAAEGSPAPQLRLGISDMLGVEIYCRNNLIEYPGAAVPGRSAVLFEGGRLFFEDSLIRADGDLVAVRSLSRVNEYYTASSLGLHNLTLDTGDAPVVSLPGPTFPNRLYACGIRALKPNVRKRLYAFGVEPDEAFVKTIPLRDPADDYKHLTGIPATNCCTIVREDVDEKAFDVTLPAAIRFLETKGPGALRRPFVTRDGATFAADLPAGPVFRDPRMGDLYVRGKTDHTDRLAALVAAAKAAGGGVVELPGKWLRISRTLELPSGVVLRSVGRTGIVMTDPAADAFVVPDGATVGLDGIIVMNGRAAVRTTAAAGRLTAIDCGFYAQGDASICVESPTPAGFAVNMSGGQAYVARFYRGNARLTVDGFWYESAPPTTEMATMPRSFATMVNEKGGEMYLRDFLGVPVTFGHFGKPMMYNPETAKEWHGDYRWIDNHATLLCKNVRFGGEYAGLTPVYHYGKAVTYLEGGVDETSLKCTNPGGPTAVLADTPEADVTMIDLLAHTYRTGLRAMWFDGTEYRPLPRAKYSNNFPFRLEP